MNVDVPFSFSFSSFPKDYCEHFIKGKTWLCDGMKRLKPKSNQGGSGIAASPGMMTIASPIPSPYNPSGRAIISGLPMNSVSSRQSFGNTSSPSFSEIHSMQQSILFESLRHGDQPDYFQSTRSDLEQSYRINQQQQQQQLQNEEQIQRQYPEQFQLPTQQQHQSQGQYTFSPMQLDSPMIQSHHQLAQNMTRSMFAPTLGAASSSRTPHPGSMSNPSYESVPQMEMVRFSTLHGPRMDSHIGMRPDHEYQHPMGRGRDEGPIGFLPGLTDTVGEMAGSALYTHNTRPIEKQDESGGVSGNSSPSSSGEKIERIGAIFSSTESSSIATRDFSKKLPVELEPRHFRYDDFIQSSLGGSHRQASSLELQWPSSSDSIEKKAFGKPEDRTKRSPSPTRSNK